jgi:hypothetical protein
VNGELKKSEVDVPPDSEVEFEYDYPHGRHRVELQVGDLPSSTYIATTVTVEDSTAPVVVTQDVVVSADPGQAFASNVTLPEPTASDASGDPVTLTQGEAPETFPVGTTLVVWTATDASGNVTTAGQKVTVEDREPPAIAEGEGMTVYVDSGKLYSTARPPLPTASDNVSAASAIRIASDAPARLPLGVTNVTFRATDEAGNSAEWTTTATVVNRPPLANAGTDVVVTTKSEKGIRVSLDGRASFDPDQQALKFAWSAPGARLGGKLTATPAGTFPVGKTFATLTVTDPAGAKHSDRVRVVVRLKHARQRPRGRDANRSFAAASQQARKAVAAKGTNAAALSALAYANAASAYGDASGEFVRWEKGQSEADATFSYAELRAVQRTYGHAAAHALLKAYAETGDESLLSAYRYAAFGTAYAAADLTGE